MAESIHKINGNDDNNNNDNDNNNSSSNSSSSSSDNDNNENNDHEHNQKYPIQSGIPPWHTLSCVILLVAITIPNLPTIASLDDYATVDTFTHCKFPNYLSLLSMGMIRLFIGSIVFSLTTYLMFISEGWDLYANYLPHTKLQRVAIKITGVRALCAFTSFSWILLGIGFVSRGLICVAFYLVEQQQQQQQEQLQDGRSNNDDDDDDNDVNKNIMIGMFQQYILHPHTWFLRLTFIAWELAAPFAMLTSVISKYVLWPQAIKSGKPHNLAGIRNQLQHNWNSIFVLTETALLGGIPVCLHHISLATGFGVCYMLFTWITGKYYFGSPTVGPQYLYFFMDTTLGKITTYAMLGLLFAMTMLYLLFSVAIQILDNNGNNGNNGDNADSLLINLVFLLIGTQLVCKFRG